MKTACELKAERTLKTPYEKSQSAERLKIIFEYSLIKSFKKYEIPATPRMISRVSAIEQNRAIKKTCCLRTPCLKTKAFCAPIAIIRDSPRKKPVNNADNINLIRIF